jgi:hypothetical protein
VPSHGRAANTLARALALWAISLAQLSAVCAAQASRPPEQRRETICAGYAEQAVAQAEENRSRDCGLFGPRWSDDHQAHYRWCLGVPFEDVRREAESRAEELERCGGPDDPAAPCRAYADEAVAHERENQRRQCGFTGPRWSLDRDGHYAWCMITQGVATRQESEARSRMLESECGEELPVDTSFCEQYSEQSAEQHAENLRRGCGFSGVGWTSSLEVHLEQCLAGSPEAARSALRSRRQALTDRCVVEPELVRVPPVERLAAELALRRIAQASLRAERLDEASGQPPGTVLGQEPEAGSLVPVGTVVTIWIAFREPPEPPGPPEPVEPPGPARRAPSACPAPSTSGMASRSDSSSSGCRPRLSGCCVR